MNLADRVMMVIWEVDGPAPTLSSSLVAAARSESRAMASFPRNGRQPTA